MASGMASGMAHTGRQVGRAGVAVGTVTWAVWLVGRLGDASAHPLWLVLFAVEVLGVATGVVVAVTIARRPLPDTASSDPDDARRRGRNDPDRYPAAIAGLLGIGDEPDLRSSVRGAWRPAFSAHTRLTDRALALVHLEVPRRLVAIAGLALSLLLGVAPLERPSLWLLSAGATGLVSHQPARRCCREP